MFLASIQSTIRHLDNIPEPQFGHSNIILKSTFEDIGKGSGPRSLFRLPRPCQTTNHFESLSRGFLPTTLVISLFHFSMQGMVQSPNIRALPIRWKHTKTEQEKEFQIKNNYVRLKLVFCSVVGGISINFIVLLIILYNIHKNSNYDREKTTEKIRKAVRELSGDVDLKAELKNLGSIHPLLEAISNAKHSTEIAVRSLSDTINKVDAEHLKQWENKVSDILSKGGINRDEIEHKHQNVIKNLKSNLKEKQDEIDELKNYYENSYKQKLKDLENKVRVKDSKIITQEKEADFLKTLVEESKKQLSADKTEHKAELDKVTARHAERVTEESKKFELYSQCPKENKECVILLHMFFLGSGVVKFPWLLNSESIGKLGEALKNDINKSVKALNFSWTRIKYNGLNYLTDGLKTNSTIESLNLRCTGIDNSDIILIANMLKRNITIQELNLSWNYIGDEGADELIKALEENTNRKLNKIDLSYTRVSDKKKQDLKKRLNIQVT